MHKPDVEHADETELEKVFRKLGFDVRRRNTLEESECNPLLFSKM